MDTLIGTFLGGYKITRFLGSGGMGAVYLAEDPLIGQQVALKIVRTDDADYPDAGAANLAAERFKQEARAVASLDHVHILPLYRYGEELTESGQRAYMVMQYRPEGALWDWIRQRTGAVSGNSLATAPVLPAGLPTEWPMSLEEAGTYLRQAASALQYAHERGIIHRDIKPANFLLRIGADHSVHLLLSDFGLAKFFSAHTSNSQVFGTPIYMAPEQFEGLGGPKSDQYALAVMIYMLLAGRAPFEGDPMHLMHQHLSKEPPPVRMFNPAVPANIESVLNHALAKDPAQRYPSVAAFANDFDQNMHQFAPGLFPQFSLPSLRSNEYAQPGSAHASTVLSSTSDRLAPHNTPMVQSQITSSSSVPPSITFQPQETFTPPAVFPTAPGLAPTQGGYAHTPVATVQTPPSQPQRITPGGPRTSRRTALGWLLGGAALLTIGGGTGIYLYLRNNTPAHALYVLRGHSAAVTSIAWSPDGTRLVSGSRDKTARLWSGANTTNIYSEENAAILAVAWSPDSNLLASGGEDQTVQVWNTAGVKQHSFPSLGASASAISWNPAGRGLLVGTLGDGTYDLLLSGKVTKSVSRISIHAIAFSPDGHSVAAALDNGSITVSNLQVPHSTHVYHRHVGAALTVAWSPDGSMLASGGTDNIARVWETVTGHVVHHLPHNGAVNGLAWEPANTGRLASASADHNVRVWDVQSSARTVYSGHTGAVTSVAWGAQGLASASIDNTVIVWHVS
ncbi:MAG: protein kinase [Ktedonobacteraceae bacterium]|nr:protein kinase [Chloroflexota bacterium]